MNIFSLSFGKDSMANLLLALEQGVPVDKVMFCDVRFSDEISGEHPLMSSWIPSAEKRLYDLFGITVDHVYAGISFRDQFFKVKSRGNHVGDIYGFPFVVGAWCNSKLKINAINRYLRSFASYTQFVGIAFDESLRWSRLVRKETNTCKYRSLLYEQCLTENDALSICDKYGLLSPIYSKDGLFRGGCWFCPKQSLFSLYCLWRDYPSYYNELLLMEPYSSNSFRSSGMTLLELSNRFRSGYVPARRYRNCSDSSLSTKIKHK